MSLWCNFSGNVFLQTVIRSRLLTSASKACWRLQLTADRWGGRFSKMDSIIAIHSSFTKFLVLKFYIFGTEMSCFFVSVPKCLCAHCMCCQQCLHKNCHQWREEEMTTDISRIDSLTIVFKDHKEQCLKDFGSFIRIQEQFLNWKPHRRQCCPEFLKEVKGVHKCWQRTL